MKGGGGVILIFFFFLFACFALGMTSVVNRVRKALRSNGNQQPETKASKDSSARESEILTQIREASELHRSGILSDEEFAAIKTKLIRGAS